MFDFMKYKFIFLGLSFILVIASVSSLVMWQLRPSIDFTGGSLLEVRISNESSSADKKDKISEVFTGQSIEISTLQPSGTDSFLVRTKEIDEKQKNEILAKLKEVYGETVVSELRFEVVGPTIGSEVTKKTFVAVIFVIGFILAYVAWISRKTTSRVSAWKFGVSAVVALLHDTLILIGVFSFLGHFWGVEVDLLFVTAVLTIMSFSVHDTIVVFDRIKETFKKQPKLEIGAAVNISLTETMTRSVNNSMTIIFMLLALLLLGGQTIFYFVLALLLGTILGTYSSPFVATPVLVIWENWQNKKK